MEKKHVCIERKKYKKEKKDSFLYFKKKLQKAVRPWTTRYRVPSFGKKKKKPKKFALFCEEFGTEQGYL